MRAFFYSLFGILGLSLGVRGVARVGRALGKILWLVLPKRRRLATDAIAFHMQLPQDEARAVARTSFQYNCQAFLDVFHRSRLDHRFVERHVHLPNPDAIEAFANETRPKIITGAHLGSWELGIGITPVLFQNFPMAMLMRTVKDQDMNDLVVYLRRRDALKVIENQKGSLASLRVLKRGGVVGFMVDHNCMRDMAVFLPFLGRIAAVHKGPAVLAMLSKATIWPTFCLRRPDGRFDFHMDWPLDAVKVEGTEEERIHAIASFYTQAAERAIRKDPEQWFWMHKRWKTRPPEEV